MSCWKLQRQTKQEAGKFWQANPVRQTRGFSVCSSLLGQPDETASYPDNDRHSSKHSEKSWTHFGYEDVLESEKKQKGKYKVE